jgi:hypothetical protein
VSTTTRRGHLSPQNAYARWTEACAAAGWRGSPVPEKVHVADGARPGPGGTGASPVADGLTATTHWAGYPDLAACGAIPTPERVIEHLDRRIITAAGVSAGIDMALRLTELLADRTAAQAAQLMIEYDPQPPFDCGARPKAGDEVMARVWEYDGQRQ